jgi:hypothetical protein
MNYRTVRCFNRASGAFVGYLGTDSATVSIVANASDAAAAWCKWTYLDGDLYMAKNTSPGDRWLGEGNSNYADWGLGSGWYAPVVHNADKTVSLKASSGRRLYGPYKDGSVDYVRWSVDDANADILRVELVNPRFWLSDVPGTTAIGDINLPGTHDSAAINPHTHTPWACHTSTITEQLNNGVRVLDVRLQVDPAPLVNPGDPPSFNFNTCHGNFGAGVDLHVYQSLTSLLIECSNFLTVYTSEFIAMSVKIDDWGGVPDADIPAVLTALKDTLTTYAPITLPGSAMPLLQDVRGKIYLLDRITPPLLDPRRKPPLPSAIARRVAAFDFGPPLDIPDNTPGALLPPVPGRAFEVYVQDKYEDLRLNDPSTEKLALFEVAIPNKPTGGLLINFASATRLKLFGVYIQVGVIRFIDATRPAVLGWSLFDYASESAPSGLGEINCVEFIIASNFNYWQ